MHCTFKSTCFEPCDFPPNHAILVPELSSYLVQVLQILSLCSIPKMLPETLTNLQSLILLVSPNRLAHAVSHACETQPCTRLLLPTSSA